MSKRRARPGDEEESEEGPASAEDRRRERKRLKAAREAGNIRARERWSPGRRALVIGAPIAVIVAIIVLLLVNPFGRPCLALQAIPAQSGIPGFPPHNTSNLGVTWCPVDATPVLSVFPALSIDIMGTSVGLPTSIGRNTSYPGGQECDLPLRTYTYALGGGMPSDTIFVVSPWPYIYTLGDFFDVWAQSYAGVHLNSTYPNQPINFSSTSIFGFSADATHSVNLWVDNHLSTAGAGLDLDTLTNSGSTVPSCMASVYGSGHTIFIQYVAKGSTATVRGLSSPVLATGGGVPDLAEMLYDSPSPHAVDYLAVLPGLLLLHQKELGWLMLRAG